MQEALSGGILYHFEEWVRGYDTGTVNRLLTALCERIAIFVNYDIQIIWW
jgi:hypothetical protein